MALVFYWSIRYLPNLRANAGFLVYSGIMAAVNDLHIENKRLKNHIEDLVIKLEDKENEVMLSAELGKKLLENNTELNCQLEEVQESCSTLVEELRQENYTLKRKNENNVYARENFISEMENMKEKLQEDTKREVRHINERHEKIIKELQVDIESVQNELEKGALVTEQLQEKISKQERMLTEAHKYSKKLEGMSILECQLEKLKEECTLMRFNNDEMKITLTDVNDEKQQLLFDQENLVQKISYLKENLEEKTIQGKEWFDTMQDLRQQVSEFQMEVSMLKAQLLNKSHKEKGNSLFGEVEDKRLVLEQKYATVTTKYESLQRTHQIIKKQLHQMKSQILPMLRMAGNQADASKTKRLEAALSQSRNEAQLLHVKNKELRKAIDERGLGSRLEQFHDASDFKENGDYVEYLQNEIKCLKKTLEDLRSDNELTTVKRIAETEKRRETESLLHASDVKKEKLQHEVVRLRLKLDELKMKLQQDAKSTDQVQESSNARENKHSIWNDASLFTKTKKPQTEEKPKENVVKLLPAVEQPEHQNHQPQPVPKAKNTSTFQKQLQPEKHENQTLVKAMPKAKNTGSIHKNISTEQPENETHESQLMPSTFQKKLPPAEQPENQTQKSLPISNVNNTGSVQTNINKTTANQPIKKPKPIGRVSPLNKRSDHIDLKGNEKVISGEEREHINESRTTPLTGSNNTSVSLVNITLDSSLEADSYMKLSKDDQNDSNHESTKNLSQENTGPRVRKEVRRRVIHVNKGPGLKNECQQQ